MFWKRCLVFNNLLRFNNCLRACVFSANLSSNFLKVRISGKARECNRFVGDASRKYCAVKNDSFVTEDGYVVVYTDGSCENNGKENARAGIGVWFGKNHALNYSKAISGKQTNNAAEIQACTAAIQIALKNGVQKLCIKTDSKFLISSVTMWMPKWKKTNWTLSNGGVVKNKDDFEKLDSISAKLDDLRWVYVAAHSGLEGNEGADLLAKAGAAKSMLPQ